MCCLRKLTISIRSTLLPYLLLAVSLAQAAEPTLSLQFGASQKVLSRTELLHLPALRSIDIPVDVAYQRNMKFQAIPLTDLLPPLKRQVSVQFTAMDGFVASLPAKLLTGAAQPWLAIEPADSPWPALKPGGSSAGPFYLVWLSPEKENVSPEQWPYQIVKISEAAPMEIRFPQIAPATSSNSAEHRGMEVYITSCAACHPLNGGGDASIGPDLNLPHNPTEYFRNLYLRKLIRNPAAVRNWGQRTMPGFSDNALSEQQLDDLLKYLAQMSRQRKQQNQH